jgi:hypothetical protein
MAIINEKYRPFLHAYNAIDDAKPYLAIISQRGYLQLKMISAIKTY